MKEAGIATETKSPSGGIIEKVGGKPSGIFVDAASELVAKVVPPPLPIVRDRAFMAAQESLLSNGITAVADMGTSAADWSVIRRAGDHGRLRRSEEHTSDLQSLMRTSYAVF